LRHLYSLILYLLLPAVLLRLWWRGARLPGYRLHWGERFGFIQPRSAARPVWIHAVSVGEVRAAAPLVAALRERWPQQPLVMTTTTPTGRATAVELYGSDLDCLYLPYDLPGSVRRFVARTAPVLGVVMETEIWPNLYHVVQVRRIPLLLANARLSEESLRRYRWFAGLARATLHCVTHIGAQSAQDAGRFQRLGVQPQRITVTGNLKFEAALAPDFPERVASARSRLEGGRPLWVAGSTHRGEEQQILEAHRRLIQETPDALLVLVPRHPERAGELLALGARAGLRCRLYSATAQHTDGEQVVIVDLLGELAALYGLCLVAFVGGSLVARGGHNPLEALLAGAPVVSGPHLENFRQVYQLLLEQGAVKQVKSAAQLARTVADWFADEAARRAVVAAGRRVIEQNRGAVAATLQRVEAALGQR